jgi:type II secretory pathway pseudopilin PulG
LATIIDATNLCYLARGAWSVVLRGFKILIIVSQSMKRLVGAAVVLVLVAGALYVWHTRQQERQRREQEAAMRLAAARATIETMVSRTGARADWERAIAGNSQLMPFETYTLDLQHAWIGPRPILFLGALEDISAADDRAYRVVLSYSSRGRLLDAQDRLRLDLLCSRALVDSILVIRGKGRMDFSGAVAVIARINRVDSQTSRDSDGSGSPVFTGFGECVEAAYVKDVWLR